MCFWRSVGRLGMGDGHMAERRTRTRIAYKAQADLECGGQKIGSLSTRDLSHKGVFILGPSQLPLGSQCSVTIHLFSEGGQGPDLFMQGTVARVTQDGAAVDFRSMDPDTYMHMRKLLILNAPDPEAVEEEFTTVAFDHPPEK